MRMRGPGCGYRTAVDADIRHPHSFAHGTRPDPDSAERLGAIEERLAWIFGSPRCGSTWLLDLLCFPLKTTPGHPTGMLRPGRRATLKRRLRHPLMRLQPEAVAINEPYLPQHLIPLMGIRFDPEDPSSRAATTLNETRGADSHYFFATEYESAWRPELRRLILTRLAAQVERAEREHALADPAVVIKEPNGSHGADLIMALLPRARLIFLVRDARDVIDSLMDAMSGGWLDEPYMGRLDTPEQRLAFARSEARVWLERTRAVERAFDAHDPELRWKLRYEDLRTDTVGTLRPLVDWLGIRRSGAELRAAIADNAFEAIPPAEKGPGTQWRAATPGLWREHMSPEERRAIEEVIGPKLVELGYNV
jgi:Sulfotransferase family